MYVPSVVVAGPNSVCGSGATSCQAPPGADFDAACPIDADISTATASAASASVMAMRFFMLPSSPASPDQSWFGRVLSEKAHGQVKDARGKGASFVAYRQPEPYAEPGRGGCGADCPRNAATVRRASSSGWR